eukprot:s1564_g7.t1
MRKYALEQPDADERDLYEKLVSREGLPCGVLDPDFAEPLDGKLSLDRGFRYTLELDCEDESLNLSRVVGSVRCEPRDCLSGFGFALLEAELPSQSQKTSEEVRTLVFPDESSRNALLALLERLQTDHRSFRRRGASLLTWLPAGCVAGCLPGCMARAKPPGVPHDTSENSPRLAIRSEASIGRHRPDATGGHLEDFKAYARQLWDRQSASSSIRKSGSLGDLSSALRQYGRRKETKETRESSDTKETRPSTVTAQPKANKDKLSANECAGLLHRLLLQADAPVPSDGQAVAGFELFRLTTTFEEFWAVLQPMLLVDQLLAEPKLQSRFGDGMPVMTLEKWSWFLVQVQNEERGVVEAAASQLKAMDCPYIDSDGHLTLAGLSTSLCVQENRAIRPELCQPGSCDMTRPMKDYWIATSHHIILETLDETECSPMAEVVLQNKRVSFADVLELLAVAGFQQCEYPIVLVLSLQQLASPRQRGEVAEVVFDKLGDRLWRSSAEMPSPEEAKGHVVVVLAPGCDMDPGLELKPKLERGGVGSTVEDSEVVEAWQEAAKRFAVWCGQVFDRTFAQKLPGEITVGFLPSDELRSLAEFKQQSMLEYHRQYLSLSFPLALRHSPVNYNLAAAWSCGVQMAAVTLGCGGDGCDGAMLAQTGLFLLNGGCGYVLQHARLASAISDSHEAAMDSVQPSAAGCRNTHINHYSAGERQMGTGISFASGVSRKPPFLRSAATEGQATAAAAPKPLYLEVRLVAARAIPGIDSPLPKGSVVLSASIWGAPPDCARQDYHPVKASGVVLYWPEVAGLGFNVANPHAAILVVELFELDQSFGGYRRIAFSAAAVHGLRQGLRWLPVLSAQGGRRPTSHGALSGMLAHISLVEGGRRASLQRACPPKGNMPELTAKILQELGPSSLRPGHPVTVHFLAAALLRVPVEAASSKPTWNLLPVMAELLHKAAESVVTKLEKSAAQLQDALERRSLRAWRGPLRRWLDRMQEAGTGSRNSPLAAWVSSCAEVLGELPLY